MFIELIKLYYSINENKKIVIIRISYNQENKGVLVESFD